MYRASSIFQIEKFFLVENIPSIINIFNVTWPAIRKASSQSFVVSLKYFVIKTVRFTLYIIFFIINQGKSANILNKTSLIVAKKTNSNYFNLKIQFIVQVKGSLIFSWVLFTPDKIKCLNKQVEEKSIRKLSVQMQQNPN